MLWAPFPFGSLFFRNSTVAFVPFRLTPKVSPAIRKSSEGKGLQSLHTSNKIVMLGSILLVLGILFQSPQAAFHQSSL